MKCEQIETVLEDLNAERLPVSVARAVRSHVAACDQCGSALRGLTALTAYRARPIPPPDPALLARIVERAAADTTSMTTSRFWQGAGIGGAVAASLVWALLTFGPVAEREAPTGAPVVTMALNEVRKVDVALQATADIRNAQIRVLLRGDIGLEGYAERRELSWTADLDAGINKLTLPVVARGGAGGQLLVEVAHGAKRRTFVVDLKVDSSDVSGAARETRDPAAVPGPRLG